MVSNEEFKKALGKAADGLSDEEIERRNILCARMAAAAFELFKEEFEQKCAASADTAKPG